MVIIIDQKVSTDTLLKRNKLNSSRGEINYDPNRDSSPYRIENFIDVLHKFGISNTSIMKKLINSPMTHINFGQDLISNMQSDISNLLLQKNKQKLPTIKSVDEYPLNKLKWNMNMVTAKAEENKNTKIQDTANSQINDNEIQLPNLNTSQSKGANKYTSPYKQSKNNRRNLSIKQSWDNPHILNKNFLLNSQAKNTAVANFGKTFNKLKDKNEINSPKQNVMELAETQNVNMNEDSSNYYGKYAKVCEAS